MANSSDEITAVSREAVAAARRETLAAGVPVFYRDSATGLDVVERPDGRKFEIRYIPGAPRDRNFEIVREVPRAVDIGLSH
jgi:hypothetical protein